MTKRKIILPQKEELKDGEKFTIHGGYYRRCSGDITLFEFTIPNVKRRPGESNESWYKRVELTMILKNWEKFSTSGKRTLRQIKIESEERIGKGLYDPIKYGGCERLKIHYIDEKPGVYHWV